MGMSFEVTALKGVNRVGDIKRLDNGYLRVILGALEFDNSIGAVYDQQRVERILATNGLFQKRINEGYLRGEWGHPKEYDYSDYRKFIQRIHTIDERNWAFHIRKVWVEPNFVLPNGQRICAILGEICSTGGRREDFDKIMANPDENLAFSIRSMATDRVVAGKVRKYIDNIITWDLVNEPGLSCANKYMSPSCESALIVPVQPAIIQSMAEESTALALESNFQGTLLALKRAQLQKLDHRQGLITRW